MDLLKESEALAAQILQWRRQLHANPELGFKEFETSKFIADKLEELGLNVKRNVGRTGVIASLGSGKPCIALRADMDALPIQDEKLVDYASKISGMI